MANEGSIANKPRTPSQIVGQLITVDYTPPDNKFGITGSSDATKVARFEVDGLTTGTTRTFTLPDATTTIAGLSVANTWTANQSFGDGTAAVSIFVNGAAASNRVVSLRTNGSHRWQVVANSTSETGSNAGSNFELRAYDDSAVLIDNVISCARVAGGTLTIARPVSLSTASSGLTIAITSGTSLTISSTTDASAVGTASAVLVGGLGVAKKIFFGGTLTAAINSGSVINADFSDTAASRTTAVVRVNSSATAHTSAGLVDIISSASTSADLMLRLRANSVNTLLCNADGSATVAGTWTWSSGGVTLSAGALAVTASASVASLTASDSGTNTTPSVLILDHTSSGTPAAGFGVWQFFKSKSDTTASRNLALFEATWATATDASRKGRFSLYAYDTAARECVRLEASGSAAMIGFLGAAAVARQATTGTATGFTAGAGTAVTHLSTFTGNSGSTAYTIGDLVLALKNYGLLAA